MSINRIKTQAQLLRAKEEQRETKKHMEFSKKWLIACMSITVFFTLFSYILAIFDKNTVSEVSVAIIQTLWSTSGVSFGGYIVQNCVRSFTATKFTHDITQAGDIHIGEDHTITTQQDETTPTIIGGGDYDYR